MRILGNIVWFCSTLVHASALYTIYMDEWCGQTYNAGGFSEFRVKLTRAAHYPRNLDCTFKVAGDSYLGEDRLMIQFRVLDTENVCNNDWLTLYDGNSNSSATIGRNKFCGFVTPSTIYTTSGSDVTFYFHSDDTIQHSGFDVILTYFQSDICDSWELECDNGRCIDSTLECNGYNPCGDQSDCRSSTGMIIGIVVGVVAVGVIIVAVVVVVLRRRSGLNRRQAAAVGTVNAPPTASFRPRFQGFSQPQQYNAPTIPGTYPSSPNVTSYPQQAYSQAY